MMTISFCIDSPIFIREESVETRTIADIWNTDKHCLLANPTIKYAEQFPTPHWFWTFMHQELVLHRSELNVCPPSHRRGKSWETACVGWVQGVWRKTNYWQIYITLIQLTCDKWCLIAYEWQWMDPQTSDGQRQHRDNCWTFAQANLHSMSSREPQNMNRRIVFFGMEAQSGHGTFKWAYTHNSVRLVLLCFLGL